MNASHFVYIVKKRRQISVSHSEPISLQKGWVAPSKQLKAERKITQGNSRAAGSYKMMPFLGHMVQACNQREIRNLGKTYLPSKWCAVWAFSQNFAILYGYFFTRPYSFYRLLANLPGLYLSKKGGLTPWGEFQDLSRGILVRSCKTSNHSPCH